MMVTFTVERCPVSCLSCGYSCRLNDKTFSWRMDKITQASNLLFLAIKPYCRGKTLTGRSHCLTYAPVFPSKLTYSGLMSAFLNQWSGTWHPSALIHRPVLRPERLSKGKVVPVLNYAPRHEDVLRWKYGATHSWYGR